MFYVWWEGFLSTEKCEHFRSFLSVRTSVFASDIVVPEKKVTPTALAFQHKSKVKAVTVLDGDEAREMHTGDFVSGMCLELKSVCENHSKGPFTQPVPGGNIALLFHIALLSKK